MKKAVVLFSGGLDSTTCLAFAKHHGFECFALSFQYGQKHAAELMAAQKIARHYGIFHRVFTLDINQFGGSALTETALVVPKHAPSNDIPITYVPARNTIFLSVALAWAEVIQADDIFIGVSHIDYSNYPDCRPEFISAFQKLANVATKKGVEGQKTIIHTPLIALSKAQTIQLGHQLGVNYGETISCYQANPQGFACGECSSCELRRQGFKEANIVDPTLYVNLA